MCCWRRLLFQGNATCRSIAGPSTWPVVTAIVALIADFDYTLAHTHMAIVNKVPLMPIKPLLDLL